MAFVLEAYFMMKNMQVVMTNQAIGCVVDAGPTSLSETADGGSAASDIIDSEHNNSENYAYLLHASTAPESSSM